MKARPLLVALAAFVIVLLGGAAMAGISAQRDTAREEPSSTYRAAEPEVIVAADEPEPTSTTVPRVEPETEKSAEVDKVEPKAVPHGEEEHDVTKGEEGRTETEPAEGLDPGFTIDYPADGSHVKSKVVAFGGTVAEGTRVHRGRYEASQHEGEWALELVLSPGKNRVAFEAVSASGVAVVASVTVYYDAPPKETEGEGTPPKETEEVVNDDKKEQDRSVFEAHQKYGSCGEEIPYDVFYGSAKPGATISASSEYGSNSTTANDDGRWEMKVTFPGAPSSSTFNVKIRASTGESKTFSFTNTGGGGDH